MFVDVLRTVIIAWVIVHHAAQAYGPTGGTWPVHDQAHSDWFHPLYTVDAAVGLGLLFLLAGYFVPAACDRKGPGRFFTERWVRIGVPLVIFVLAVNLPAMYVVKGRPAPGEFIRELYDSGWQLIYLHLWFLGHLLLYSGIYVAWRLAAGSRPRRTWAPPGHAAIVGFVVALALLTWIVRLWYPVDKWVPLLYVLAGEPAKMPQYISLFAVGVMAYRGDWLRRMPTKAGMIWLGVGLLAAAGIFVLQALGQWNLLGSGGLNWPSLVRSTWEAVICVGLSGGADRIVPRNDPPAPPTAGCDGRHQLRRIHRPYLHRRRAPSRDRRGNATRWCQVRPSRSGRDHPGLRHRAPVPQSPRPQGGPGHHPQITGKSRPGVTTPFLDAQTVIG